MFVAVLLGLALEGAPLAAAQGARPKLAAMLETRNPALDEFLLRGTVPLPRGVYPRADKRNPFSVFDVDGRPVTTQVEIVSSYPDASAGADVVEILANVHRDAALPIGARVRYGVVYSEEPDAVPRPEPSPVPDEVDQLLLDPASIEIAAYDCFGNRYVARPTAPQPFDVLHFGPLHAEIRAYGSMLPERFVPGSTLSHGLGVHTYLSWFADRTCVGLDVRFHNAHDGHDSTSALDDPIERLYFERIELSIPADWRVQQDFPDPAFGGERIAGGRRIVDIVAPEPNGKMHVIRWGGQFHRRLMLSPNRAGAIGRARAVLDGAGRAFVVRAHAADGRELWSWWNRETARYFPQRFQLPLLDHVGAAALDAEIASEHEFLRAHLASGRGEGDYPIQAGRLGWGHPYGVPYGGMTGGLEINLYDGVVAASAASPLAIGLYQALHRMHTDRQPNALFDLSGEPSSVEEWLIDNGNNDYVPFDHFNVPLVQGSRPDPFGVRSSPRFQTDYVVANGLVPSYEGAHFGFDPHDHQHFIRYTRALKVLAWLANDSLAIDDLRLQAENRNLSFHQFANAPNGGYQGSGLLAKIRYVQQYPHKGFGFGRGEAWGLDCAIAAYACADEAWRARKLPWIARQAEVLLDGQSTCTGFIQAIINDKAVDGRYRARQLMEQSITENMLVGLYESVFSGAHPGYAAMVLDVLGASLRSFIGELSWWPGQNGPWRYTGVGPLDPAQPVWCSRAQMPPDSVTIGDLNTFQDWSSFAYGHELTGDPAFLRKAQLQIGAPNFAGLAQRLDAGGLQNLENRAALLSVVQRLQGRL